VERYLFTHRLGAFLIALIVLVPAVSSLWLFLRPRGQEPRPRLGTTAAPFGAISLQVSGSAESANRILLSWEGSRLETARNETLVDYGFILVYSAALSLGVMAGAAAVSRKGKDLLPTVAVVLAWAVFLAGLLDAVENLFLARMIDIRTSGRLVEGDFLPVGAAICAWPKLTILLAATLYVAATTLLAIPEFLRTRSRRTSR
jgi:hypothetical protein